MSSSKTDYADDFTKLDYTFDINLFNRLYNEFSEKKRTEQRAKDKETLEEKHKELIEGKQIKDMTLWEIFFNMKDSVNDLVTDLYQLKFEKDTFTKNNRLTYLGLFLIIIVFLFFVFDILFKNDNAVRKENFNTQKVIYRLDIPELNKLLEKNKL